jgi:aspartate aminotransferase
MILTDDELFASWKKDITTMSSRIIEMRDALFDLLNNKLKTPPPPGRKDWSHITEQIVSR